MNWLVAAVITFSKSLGCALNLTGHHSQGLYDTIKHLGFKVHGFTRFFFSNESTLKNVSYFYYGCSLTRKLCKLC